MAPVFAARSAPAPNLRRATRAGLESPGSGQDRVSPTGRGPGATAVIASPTAKTVTAPTTLYQRKATLVVCETRKTAAMPAKSP